MFLVDTNIFLEIFLTQERNEDCKNFLNQKIGQLYISDFSLHSIGVILFRYGKEDAFLTFIEDVMADIGILSLPIEYYSEVIKKKKHYKLDFDDAYQYSLAQFYDLKLATMDKDFEKIGDNNIIFL